MDLNKLRKEITVIIDDIKYHSDSLTELERLPVIQLKVILAKINKLNEKTTILLHYVEMQSQDSSNTSASENDAKSSADKKHNIDTETNEAVEKEKIDPVEEAIKVNDKKVVEEIGREKTMPDLMSAIGINEKYLYASELFEGNMEVFKSTVAAINEISSLEDANKYLDALSQKFKWDDENKAVIEFSQFIQRRFEVG